MDNYVLRIYKREKTAGTPETMRGVVEDPVTGLRRGFESIEELWMMIGTSSAVHKETKTTDLVDDI